MSNGKIRLINDKIQIAIFVLTFLSLLDCQSALKVQDTEMKNSLLPAVNSAADPENGKSISNPYLAGLDYYKKEDFHKAIEEFKKANKTFPKIEDYSLYYLFKIHKRRGEYDECKKDYEILVREFPQSRWIEECMYNMGEIYFKQEEWKESVKSFYEFNKKFPRSDFISTSFFKMGLSFAAFGEKDRAKEVFTFLWLYYPWTYESKEAENYLKENIYKVKTLEDIVPPSELLIRAKKLFEVGRFRESASILKHILKGDFQRYYKLKALKRVAECYEKEKEYLQALDAYKKLIAELEKDKDQKELPEIYLRLAKTCYQLNYDEEFNLVENTLLKSFPDSPIKKDFLYIAGRYREDERKYYNALNAFDKVLGIDVDGVYAEEALWHIGWIYYLKGDFEASSKYFLKQREILKKQENIDKAIYWYFKSLEKNKGGVNALKKALKGTLQDDSNYYGILCKNKLAGKELPFYYDRDRFDRYQKVISENISDSYLKLPEKIWSEAIRRAFPEETKYFIERATILREMNLIDDLIAELKYARKTIPESDKKSLMNLAEIFWASGDYYTSIKILGEVQKSFQMIKDEEFKRMVKIFYPLPYMEKVYKYSYDFGVDPFLILAIIRQESLFNPHALSPVGAMGLFQLMPATAVQILQEGRILDFKEGQLYDKDISIYIGTKYIKNLLEKYNNNLVFTIAAYNAGEHKIKEWSSRFADREIDEFIESIPYPETKNYVKKVITNYENYYRIYGKEEDELMSNGKAQNSNEP